MSTRTTRSRSVPEIKYYAAVRDALAEELKADPTTVLMGEDIGAAGGIYAETHGLQDEFGSNRVLDTPAGELGFVGAAVGCALTGLRPIVEISFADFFPVCMDQLVNQAAKIRYMSGGQTSVPLTVFSFGGGGLNAGPQHSGTYEAWLGSMPGLKVVTPATPRSVKGLMKAAIRDDDPVVVLLHKGLLQVREEVPEYEEVIPLGSAEILCPGTELTIVSWSGGVRRAVAAAAALAEIGVDAEVIDLRSIQPLDVATVAESVRRTHRLLIVQETTGFAGIGAELAAVVVVDAFDYLDAPIERIAAPFTPVPFSPPLEKAHLPQVEDIVERAKAMVTL
ncbi:alpha-ketoacid dehydrogenase subunit beta [Nocardia gamkensis]|uniref:alpha-ketoacid dehydrogenase subunit beta n=1 Tax=Nocardia gamkensis TaxID=352869 RepID=UPI0036E9EFAA